MDVQQFTSDEFERRVFNGAKLDKKFLLSVGNRKCIQLNSLITPMVWAAANNHLDIIKCLLEHGVNYGKNKAIRMAAVKGQLKIRPSKLIMGLFASEQSSILTVDSLGCHTGPRWGPGDTRS